MSAKVKLILGTAISTTFAWALVLATVLYLCNRNSDRPVPIGTFTFCPPKKEPFAIFTWGHQGDPSAVEWEAQGGDYLIQVLSSNLTSASATLLYSRTSRPPERIQFRTVLVEPHTNR
jgi:hypothetical protein